MNRKQLSALKARLKKEVADKKHNVLEVLERLVDDKSPKINEIYLLIGRIKSAERKWNADLITEQEYAVKENKIAKEILDFIGGLEINDIESRDIEIGEELQRKSFYSPSGLAVKPIDEALRVCIGLIQDASILRVIGIGRQDKVEYNNIQVMDDYYRAIEERIKKEKENVFHYRRITTQDLKSRFQEHIENSLELSEQNKNVVEVVLRENLYLALTYVIVDQKAMMVNLYTRDEVGIKDNTMVFWSTDYEIIKYFAQHFDDAWRNEEHKETIVSQLHNFRRILPVDAGLSKDLRRIRWNIRRLPRRSLQKQYAKRQLEVMADNIESARFGSLQVRYRKDNENLSNYFRWYMDKLDRYGEYHTISCLEFWENIVDPIRFLRRNKLALERRAKIVRYYLVDDSRLSDGTYIERHQKILKKNFDLFRRHPNYYFAILPVEDYESEIDDYQNFALWKNEQNGALFIPNSHSSPKFTSIIFFGADDLIENSIEEVAELTKAQESLNDIKERMIEFHQEDNKDEFVAFLKKCGIDPDMYFKEFRKRDYTKI